jgi:hypothetical protein
MSPAIQTYSDTEFAHLTAQLAKVTAERDRAREIAVALEQEVAAVEAVAVIIQRAAKEPVEDFTAGSWRQLLYMAAHDIRAALARGGAA